MKSSPLPDYLSTGRKMLLPIICLIVLVAVSLSVILLYNGLPKASGKKMIAEENVDEESNAQQMQWY
jgi:hypothetical protein